MGGRLHSGNFTTMLRIVGQSIDQKTRKTRLRLVAEKVFEEAQAGNMRASELIAERLDGKVTQPILDQTPPDGRPAIQHGAVMAELIDLLQQKARARAEGKEFMVIDITPKAPVDQKALPSKKGG